MKIIIAGSRTIPKEWAFWYVLNMFEPFAEFSLTLWFSELEVTELVTGCCPTGPDQVPFMIDEWWNQSGYRCRFDIVKFEADWKQHWKAAGPIRNREMAQYSDALILIWDGKSRGSANMKKEMEKLNKPVYETVIEGVELLI